MASLVVNGGVVTYGNRVARHQRRDHRERMILDYRIKSAKSGNIILLKHVVESINAIWRRLDNHLSDYMVKTNGLTCSGGPILSCCIGTVITSTTIGAKATIISRSSINENCLAYTVLLTRITRN